MARLIYQSETRYTCATCQHSGMGDPRNWHHYRHMFSQVGGIVEQPSPVEQIMAAGDHVLRMALVMKGVITPDDLVKAHVVLSTPPDMKEPDID